MHAEAPLVRFERASRHYLRGSERVPALTEVSFALFAGEQVALVGPSGCGKSTLLGLVAGVDAADSGLVVVCGRDLSRASESDLLWLRRNAIGVVFQAFHLMPNLTVEENVRLPLALARRKDEARVQRLLIRVGLESRRSHYPAQLSGGEQQRTALARALVHRPQVLVADEPTGNLDSQRGAEVLALLRELRQEEGAAVLLATHDLQLAAQADRTLYMRDGRISSEAAQ